MRIPPATGFGIIENRAPNFPNTASASAISAAYSITCRLPTCSEQNRCYAIGAARTPKLWISVVDVTAGRTRVMASAAMFSEYVAVASPLPSAPVSAEHRPSSITPRLTACAGGGGAPHMRAVA